MSVIDPADFDSFTDSIPLPHFREGDRVLLSDRIGYHPVPDYPVMNSKYHSEGVITGRYNGFSSERYNVRWDNGEESNYYWDHLVLVRSKYELPDELFTIEV